MNFSKKLLILLCTFVFIIYSISGQSNNELTRQDAPLASLTLLTELKEAVGWYRDSLGQWSSSNENKITPYSSPERNNNFTHISIYNVNHDKKNYYVLDIGYLISDSNSDRRTFSVGNRLYTYQIPGTGTGVKILTWSDYFIINTNKFKISLKENRPVRNSIEYITSGINTSNDRFQSSITLSLRAETKLKGRIYFYTLFNKEENTVRFYLKQQNSSDIYAKTAFEDYYYEVPYQKFIEVFGNWIK